MLELRKAYIPKQSDEKCTAAMKAVASTLPSTTQYGMAALLPHESLELTADYSILVDGQKTDTLEQRQAILQKYKPDGICVQYDEISNMTIADMKLYFAWKPVTYIYHNQYGFSSDPLLSQNRNRPAASSPDSPDLFHNLHLLLPEEQFSENWYFYISFQHKWFSLLPNSPRCSCSH